MNSRN